MAAQSVRWDPSLDGTPFHHRATDTHIHPHSDWGSLHTPVLLMFTSLGCGTKLEYPEKPHTDMRTCKLHTDRGPARNQFCFSHEHSTQTTLNEIMLFEDLLYLTKITAITTKNKTTTTKTKYMCNKQIF